MKFRHLEDMLTEQGIDLYSEIISNMKEPFVSIFNYLLDITSFLDSEKLKSEYKIIGGYAVLTHIVDQYGEKVIPKWRGSKDIDIIGSDRVHRALKREYNILSIDDRPSPNLLNKRTIKIKNDENTEFEGCKIDFVSGDQNLISEYQEEKKILEIPIMVTNSLGLIKYKLAVTKEELEHKEDILKLIGIMEQKGQSVSHLVDNIDHTQRESLYNLLKEETGPSENVKFSFDPNIDYLRLLRASLKKHIIH